LQLYAGLAGSVKSLLLFQLGTESSRVGITTPVLDTQAGSRKVKVRDWLRFRQGESNVASVDHTSEIEPAVNHTLTATASPVTIQGGRLVIDITLELRHRA